MSDGNITADLSVSVSMMMEESSGRKRRFEFRLTERVQRRVHRFKTPKFQHKLLAWPGTPHTKRKDSRQSRGGIGVV